MTIQHRAVCDVCGTEAQAIAVTEVGAFGVTGGAALQGYRYDHPLAWVRVEWWEGQTRRETWVCAWRCVEQLAQAKDGG